MKNETKQNNAQTQSFLKSINWKLEDRKEELTELRMMKFNIHNIKWASQDLVMAEEQVAIYDDIVWDLRNIDSEFTDEDLTKYLIGKVKGLISYAKSCRPCSTSQWTNAIECAKNEAILEVVDNIQRYI